MKDQLFPWARTDDLTLGLLKQLNNDFVIRMGASVNSGSPESDESPICLFLKVKNVLISVN